MIAKKAMAKNTGARGLRAILESSLTDAMYEVCILCKQMFRTFYFRLLFPFSIAVLSGIITLMLLCQIPDVKTGNERIDAVVVDEESVGSVDALGCGGKILHGDGALERYLAENKLKDLVV